MGMKTTKFFTLYIHIRCKYLNVCIPEILLCSYYCRQFFRNACEVEDPETKFNINQYTDVTMVTKPIIYMSTQEICDTHQLLLEHQEVITTDNSDPLHELLEDLGDAPSITALMGNLPSFVALPCRDKGV